MMPLEGSGRFRLGVNYWPAGVGMRWWRRFALEAVAADFARIRGAGFDSVRLFLLWEDFQPTAMEVSTTALRRLVSVADVAAEAGLELMPTLFTGHMSGVNWIPAWALGGTDGDERFRVVSDGVSTQAGLRNWYVDDDMLACQELMAVEAASALKGHAAVWAWDLGNENSNCVIPPNREAGHRWLARMTDAIRSADPGRPITLGLHMEDLEEDRRIGPAEAGEYCDFLCMHGYPIYADWAADPTDELVLPFLASVTSWLSGGKDVLFAEFGLPTYRRGDPDLQRHRQASSSALIEEREAAAYIERGLRALHKRGTTGAMLWCYADYDPLIWHEPPFDLAVHERFFGLWRADATPKPAVAEVAAYSGRTRVRPADDWRWIDLDPAEFYQHPRAHLARLYSRFRGAIGQCEC
jgi:endo-1,4-beta-mannosidase